MLLLFHSHNDKNSDDPIRIISLLKEEPERRDVFLWRDLSFFQNTFFLLFVSCMTTLKEITSQIDENLVSLSSKTYVFDDKVSLTSCFFL